MRHDNGPCLHTRKLAGAEKHAVVSRHEMIKKKKKKIEKEKTLLDVRRKGERLIEGHALNIFNIVTLVRVRKGFSNSKEIIRAS